ncbi:MAG: chemotaxis protein CheW [Acidobacteriota bacterium]
MSASSFLKFSIGDQGCCINLSAIHEITSIKEYQKVPKAPPEIKGISEAGGRILTLIELATIFKRDPTGTIPFYAVILAPPRSHLALTVYSEFDILDGEPIPLEEEKGKDDCKRTMPGTPARLGTESVILLDSDRIIKYCETKVLESFKIHRSDPE